MTTKQAREILTVYHHALVTAFALTPASVLPALNRELIAALSLVEEALGIDDEEASRLIVEVSGPKSREVGEAYCKLGGQR